MQVRIPALADESCPYCGAASIGATVAVWRVADPSGAHFECDRCKHDWPATRSPVIATAKHVRI